MSRKNPNSLKSNLFHEPKNTLISKRHYDAILTPQISNLTIDGITKP
jgi:hypothetical protein